MLWFWLCDYHIRVPTDYDVERERDEEEKGRKEPNTAEASQRRNVYNLNIDILRVQSKSRLSFSAPSTEEGIMLKKIIT